MKAYIDGNGMLVVTPDTHLENYALKMWAANYDVDDTEHPSELMIETLTPEQLEELGE